MVYSCISVLVSIIIYKEIKRWMRTRKYVNDVIGFGTQW